MNFLFFILYLISLLPLSVTHQLARVVGILSFYCAKKRRYIGETNLKFCFPEKSHQEIQILLKTNFYHFACMLFEYSICWHTSKEKIKNIVRIEGQEILEKIMNQQENCILLYPHFSALELGALRLNIEYPIISIFTGQKNKKIDKKIYEGRTRFGNVYLIRRNDGLLSIIKKIKKTNAPFLYLPDQDFGRKDSIFVPFFGIMTATTTGVSRIAKLTNAKVIPLMVIRENFGKFKIVISDIIKDFPTDDIFADTTKVNLIIEEMVRQHPEQYFWLHKRFKTRPKEEKSFYQK